tara:strand:+ start:212 stop:352 length:141 start_codon:yes stop_codon:yes gene_type:complete
VLYTIERDKQDWELEHDKEMRKQELMEQEEERMQDLGDRIKEWLLS